MATKNEQTLYTSEYDQYFVYLDKFICYQELLKTQNILKKREKTFIVELEENLNEDSENTDKGALIDERLSQIKITNIACLDDPEFLENFLASKEHIKTRIDREEQKRYDHSECIIVSTVFQFPEHLFWRLSILIQRHCLQRFDW